MTERYTHKSRIEAPAQTVFDWHKRAGALERLMPPWHRTQVLERRGTIRDGDRTTIRTGVAGVTSTWLVEHRDYVEGRQFRDLQLKGPFARWEHTHRFEAIDEWASFMIDEVEYELPLGGFGEAMGAAFVKDQLKRMFTYRHRILAEDIAEHHRVAGGQKMTVAVSGAKGLVGRSLVPFLTTGGHQVRRIVRGDASEQGQIAWLPQQSTLDTAALEGADAVVHLAGENIIGRWAPDKKRRIRDSRVVGTHGIATALASMQRKPGVLVCASAVGYYGSRGEGMLTEDSPRGDGFLPEVCEQWEQATRPAADAGIRVVNLRMGVVLSPQGGALRLMLPVFRMGLGGPIGDGEAWTPWITIEDVVGIIHFALFNEGLRGPVNAVAPAPVRNREFVKTLGHVLHRPAVMPAPAFALRRTMGEMADEMLLASLRVSPLRLAQAGYSFRHTDLETGLRHVLGRT